MQKYIPKLVVAGVPKCATTSLFYYLSKHPKIVPSYRKETFFLMDKEYPLYDASLPNYHNLGISGYKNCFLDSDIDSGAVLMDASADYIYQHTALGVLSDIDPQPLIVVLVRRPSHRILSMFNFAQNNIGTLRRGISFSDYVDILLSGDTSSIERDTPLLAAAIDQSNYAKYLDRWQAKFGNNMIVFKYESFVEDPSHVLKTIYDRLGLTDFPIDEGGYEQHNKTVKIRYRFLEKLRKRFTKDDSKHGPIMAAIKRAYWHINKGKSVGFFTPKDEEALGRLDVYFKPHYKYLEDRYGLDLNSWE